MKKLHLKDDLIPNYIGSDVRDMRDALLEIGFSISEEDMYKAWDRYSATMAASWMIPPKDGWDVYYSIQSEVYDVEEKDGKK